MSVFRAKCESCETLFEVPHSYLGQEVKCPTCATDMIAEPTVELGPEKKPLPSAPSIISPPRKVGGKKKGEDSYLHVTPKQLILYSIYRCVGIATIVLAFIYLAMTFSPRSDWNMLSIGPFIMMLMSGLFLLGIAQVIQLFHSMAWNTQQMAKKDQE
jgi:predicted Zn finger-like uncharacterized protein